MSDAIHRHNLPMRRSHDVIVIVFQNMQFTIGFHRDLSGKLREVFIDPYKHSSTLHDAVRDIAMLISLALQYEVDINILRSGLSRFHDGQPAGIAAAVLDVIEAEVA